MRGRRLPTTHLRHAMCAYEEAAVFLRKLGRLRVQHGHRDGWWQYITELREANKRKRRLLEVLALVEAEMQRG